MFDFTAFRNCQIFRSAFNFSRKKPFNLFIHLNGYLLFLFLVILTQSVKRTGYKLPLFKRSAEINDDKYLLQ